MTSGQLYRQERRKTQRLIRRGVLVGKKVVLFGASNVNAWLKIEVERAGLSVHAVVDNDPRKAGTNFAGVAVSSPETALLPYDPEVAVLVTSEAYWAEIVHQLRALGYDRRQHVHVIPENRALSLTDFRRSSTRVLKGARAHRSVRRRCRGEDTLLVLAPFTGTGDAHSVGMFLPALLRERDVKDYLLVCGAGRNQRIAEAFGLERTMYMPRARIEALIDYLRVARADLSQVVGANPGTLDNTTIWMDGFKGIGFDDMYRYVAFGLDDDAPVEPLRPSASDGDVAALLRRRGLPEGRTVVLAPYTVTLPLQASDEFWAALVRALGKAGLTVCTNVSGPTEEPIPGTTALHFPVEWAPDVVTRAGRFVGARSGLCELVSTSPAAKVVLYQAGLWWRRSSARDYFSLEKVAPAGTLTELEYREADMATIVDEIVEALR